jgi:small redox-active disulfide protein 2
MKKITVYGPGCARCKQTEDLARQVIAETGADAVVEKVTDVQAMVKAGIMSTPAVAVDGVTKVAGRVPKAEELRQWIAG